MIDGVAQYPNIRLIGNIILNLSYNNSYGNNCINCSNIYINSTKTSNSITIYLCDNIDSKIYINKLRNANNY